MYCIFINRITSPYTGIKYNDINNRNSNKYTKGEVRAQMEQTDVFRDICKSRF